MDETITIKIPKGRRSRMIAEAKREMFEALADLDPPYNDEMDKVKMHACSAAPDGVQIVYRIIRGAPRNADASARNRDRGR